MQFLLLNSLSCKYLYWVSSKISVILGMFALMCRLTFWWSNTVVLREIVSQTFESSQLSPQALRSNGSNGVKKNHRLPSPQKMRDSHNKQGGGKLNPKQSLNDWEETHTLTTALEKVELWIYGRVIESVWWQVKYSLSRLLFRNLM